MFSLGGNEFLIIVVVALLLFGPDKIPQLARTVGRFTREFNKYKDIMESTIRMEISQAEGPTVDEMTVEERIEKAGAASQDLIDKDKSAAPGAGAEGEIAAVDPAVSADASDGELAGTSEASAGHTITASAGLNGSISPSGAHVVANGENLKFTITPDGGYQIAEVFADGESVGAAGTYTFFDVAEGHTISATFEAAEAAIYTIAASPALNGSISPAGFRDVTEGESQTFAITPDSGYVVSDVLVDGESVGAVGSYTFDGVAEDHTIAVTFEPDTVYTITPSAGPNGSITPWVQSVLGGDDLIFAITPDSGYVVSDVLVDGESVGAVSGYTFDNIAEDHTIAVTFSVAPTHTITVSAGPNGSTSPFGDLPVAEGESQEFTITPDSGYVIADVLVDDKSVGAVKVYTFSDVTEGHTISVTFGAAVAASSYTIAASAGPNGSISPSGAHVVANGEKLKFTITPDGGYQIAEVFADGESVGAAGTYTFFDVTEDHTISAIFEVAEAAVDAIPTNDAADEEDEG